MAVQFLRPGVVLFKRHGVPAMSPDCCCGCCPEAGNTLEAVLGGCWNDTVILTRQNKSLITTQLRCQPDMPPHDINPIVSGNDYWRGDKALSSREHLYLELWCDAGEDPNAPLPCGRFKLIWKMVTSSGCFYNCTQATTPLVVCSCSCSPFRLEFNIGGTQPCSGTEFETSSECLKCPDMTPVIDILIRNPP